MAEGDQRGPSYGNISDQHWSRARRDANREAIDYYRERSKAPGVAEGGGARNFYCMKCDGVIPHEPPVTACPHCGAEVDPHVKRYFNWVEMGEPASSDLRALLPILLAGAAVLLAALVFAMWWLAR
jgi:hypothetical protein